jgi:hypothetical protein
VTLGHNTTFVRPSVADHLNDISQIAPELAAGWRAGGAPTAANIAADLAAWTRLLGQRDDPRLQQPDDE